MVGPKGLMIFEKDIGTQRYLLKHSLDFDGHNNSCFVIRDKSIFFMK